MLTHIEISSGRIRQCLRSSNVAQRLPDSDAEIVAADLGISTHLHVVVPYSLWERWKCAAECRSRCERALCAGAAPERKPSCARAVTRLARRLLRRSPCVVTMPLVDLS